MIAEYSYMMLTLLLFFFVQKVFPFDYKRALKEASESDNASADDDSKIALSY